MPRPKSDAGKKFPESFNTRVLHVVDTKCWKLEVTNYGENKTSWNFYTRSEQYAAVKRDIILKISPDANVIIIPGTIQFV